MDAEALDWDDLRVFLAVARAGSLTGGGQALHLNQSTTSRRVGRMEDKLGVRLFDRRPRGLSLTADGEEVLAFVERLGAEVDALTKSLTGRDARLAGRIAFATADTLLDLVAETLAAFCKNNPGIRLDVRVSSHEVSLGRHEADLVLRATRRPPDSAFGRNLGPVAVSTYVKAGRGRIPHDLPWVAPELRFGPIDKTPGSADVAARFDTTPGLVAAVRHGMGRAVLPCFVADYTPGLRRVPGATVEQVNDLWLLAPSDLRRTARVRALLGTLADALVPLAPRFAGERGGVKGNTR